MRQVVLIIDDDEALRKVLAYELGHDAYDVVGVGSGEAALEQIACQSIDLILLDIGLPDCNGFDLFHQLRKVTTTPVIFLTVRKQCVDKVAGLELGAEDYLPKPFDTRELLARMRVVLRRVKGNEVLEGDTQSPPEELIQERSHGALHLDEARMIIHYHGQAVDLTHYEYLILRFLLVNPGRVISRSKLLDILSINPDGPYERVIDSHISAIRIKLRNISPEENPISTRRNAGYVLKEQMG